MILTQTLDLSRLDHRIKSGLVQAQLRLHKLAKAKAKKAKRQTLVAIRSQYYFSRAYTDMRRAIVRNEDIFIASVIVAAVLAYAATLTAGQLLITFLNTGYALSELAGVNIFFTLSTALAVLSVLYGWAMVLGANMLAVSVMDGHGRKKIKSIRATARKSLGRASHVTLVWFALAGLVAVPLGIFAVGAWIFLQFNPLSPEALFDFISVAAIAAIAWLCLILMNFSLAPYVALFEPQYPLLKTFQYGRRLVKTRGRLFVLIGYVLLLAALGAAFKIAQLMERILLLNKLVAFALLASVILMFAHCMAVTFYRKRRLARK